MESFHFEAVLLDKRGDVCGHRGAVMTRCGKAVLMLLMHIGVLLCFEDYTMREEFLHAE